MPTLAPMARSVPFFLLACCVSASANDWTPTPTCWIDLETHDEARLTGSSILAPLGTGDSDGDGLTDAEEAMLGTDSQDVDSDCDGHDDGSEVGPVAATPLDDDGDGRIDALESGRIDSDLDGTYDEQDPDGGWQPGCAKFRPFAVATDGISSTRLEIRIVGTGVTGVALGSTAQVTGMVVEGVPKPPTGFIDLYDDGTHGDRVAGDGLWSRDQITSEYPSGIRLADAVLNLIQVTDLTGTTTKDLYSIGGGTHGAVFLGYVSRGELEAPVQVAPGVQRVSHLVNLIDPLHAASARRYLMAEPPIGLIPLIQEFYSHFPDDYDFLFLVPESPSTRGLRGAAANVSNDVSGIGRMIADQTATYGSAGRLQAIVIRNFMYNGPNLHEMLHRWVPGLSDTLGFYQCAPSHWGYAGIGVGPVGGFDPASWIDHGDGTYSVARFPPGGRAADADLFNPLDLYLAGLLPAGDVPSMLMPVNLDCSSVSCDGTSCARLRFVADGAAALTINDIVAEHGPRSPAYPEAQSAFRAAWIVASQAPLTDAELAYYNSQARYLGLPAGDGGFFISFQEATQNRGTLDTSIPGATGPAGAVPDGATRPGVPLMVDRATGGAITLSWSSSCSGSDEDYAIYEGMLGEFTSHMPVTCSTSGYTAWTITPAPSSTYYLLVPNSEDREGSYGMNSNGLERPVSAASCLLQQLGLCAQ